MAKIDLQVMNPFSSISEAYKRWRHSRGFGVHSPFAYDLVKNVISPGNYAYYGYRDIDRTILSPEVHVYSSLRNDARLLLRLLVWLNVKRLLIYPPSQTVFATVAAAAGIKSMDASNLKALRPNVGELLIVSGKTPGEGEISEIIRNGIPIIAYDPSLRLRNEMKGAMKDGLILEGTRIILAIPRPEMALTSYTVRF